MDADTSLTESLRRLKAGIPPNCCFIILGSLAIILNGWTIFCIIRSKSVHSKCFALLACNAGVDFLLGASYGAIGATRLYRYKSGEGEVISMWRCCWEASLITFAQMISLGMSAALVIDRLASTLIPHTYKMLTYRKFTIPLVIGALMYALAQSCVHFHDSWEGRNRTLLTCGIEDTINPASLSVLITIQITTSTMVVAGNLYLAVIIILRRRKFKQTQIQSQGSNAQFEQEKMEFKIFKTITVIVIMHILTHMGGRLTLFAVTSLTSDVQTQSLTSRYSRLLVVINAAIHFLILYSTSTQFRAAVKGNSNVTKVTKITVIPRGRSHTKNMLLLHT